MSKLSGTKSFWAGISAMATGLGMVITGISTKNIELIIEGVLVMNGGFGFISWRDSRRKSDALIAKSNGR